VLRVTATKKQTLAKHSKQSMLSLGASCWLHHPPYDSITKVRRRQYSSPLPLCALLSSLHSEMCKSAKDDPKISSPFYWTFLELSERTMHAFLERYTVQY
jgi:hypothetical protein